MTTVAFIGLGIMGAPMARNLIAAGHEVTGVNRSRPAVDRLVEAGGRAADSVAEAGAAADVVLTMLPDSPDVEAVALGDDGIYATAKPGTLHVDCATIRPDVAAQLAAEGAAHGIAVVDAPVSGGEIGAIGGTLSVMVGGNEKAAELSGIAVAKVKLAVYAIAGVCAGIAGLVVIAIN